MRRKLSGNQIGPRQLELPPKRAVRDSAGSYSTEYSIDLDRKDEGFVPHGGG